MKRSRWLRAAAVRDMTVCDGGVSLGWDFWEVQGTYFIVFGLWLGDCDFF
jgi:hypothetical protein